MKKLLLFFSFILACMPLHAAQILRGPYIEDPTQTTMILKWQTDEPTPGWVEYGPVPRCNQIMTVSPETSFHKVVLYGLVPNQEFCYRIYVQNKAKDGVQTPVEGRFRTLFTPERKEVRFLALGNTGAAEPGWTEDGLPEPDVAAQSRKSLADLMKQEKSDFFIHTGNITHSGLDKDADHEFFTPFKEVLANNPLFVALGPNEYGPDRAEKESKSFLRTNYSRFHDMSWGNATPKYYSFDTANARFIFLDGNVTEGAVWGPNTDAQSQQTQWLKTMLAGAPEKWKIVVVNSPIYSTGAHGANHQLYADWGQIFENYQVNLVLQGADANYERTFPMLRGAPGPRGVTYVTLGGGGAPLTKRVSSDSSTARFVSAYHYAVGSIVDRKLTLKVYNNTGKLLDTLELYM